MDGIGPEDINIPSLIERLKNDEVSELILAMNPNLEGESTAMYISRLVKPIGIKVTRLAIRVICRYDLEYADEAQHYLKQSQNRNVMSSIKHFRI